MNRWICMFGHAILHACTYSDMQATQVMLYVMLLCGDMHDTSSHQASCNASLWGWSLMKFLVVWLSLLSKTSYRSSWCFIMTCIGALNSQILLVYYMPKKSSNLAQVLLYMLHLSHLPYALKYSVCYIIAITLLLYHVCWWVVTQIWTKLHYAMWILIGTSIKSLKCSFSRVAICVALALFSI